MLHAYSRAKVFQCVTCVHSLHLCQCVKHLLSYTVISMCYTRTLVVISMCYTHTLGTFISMCYRRTLVCSYLNVLHAYSSVKLLQCVTRVLSCVVMSMCYTRTLVVTSMCYTHTFGTVISMCFSSLKWLHSKQPKLGLTQEFVVDCAHALWVVHTTKRLVSLMLLKGFLCESFIYFMYRMLDENV